MTTRFERQRQVRRWHRRIALLCAAQLLAWTLSGAFFAFVDIEGVRGSDHRRAPQSGPLPEITFPALSAPASSLKVLWRLPREAIVSVETEKGAQWYSSDGNALAPLSASEALVIGTLRTDLAPNQAEWVETAEAGVEYRGAPLPLWRVYHSDHPSTVAYLHGTSGQVLAIRNTSWRWWDFLWSLHIMDYDTRDEIGTWLLKLFSLLAVATAIAGLGLYFLSPQRGR